MYIDCNPDWGVKVWVGQNIYQGQPDWDVVLNGWWDEVTDPGFTWGVKYSGMMNRGKPIGHYTQVSTHRVTCFHTYGGPVSTYCPDM